MKEWILIISMQIIAEGEGIKAVEFQTLDGFQSQNTCLEAAKIITKQISEQTKRHIEHHKEKSNSITHPSIHANCIEITK